MEKVIKIERSESFLVDAADIKFENMSNNIVISGLEWVELPQNQQDGYLPMTRDAELHSFDGQTEHFDVSEYTSEYFNK